MIDPFGSEQVYNLRPGVVCLKCLLKLSIGHCVVCSYRGLNSEGYDPTHLLWLCSLLWQIMSQKQYIHGNKPLSYNNVPYHAVYISGKYLFILLVVTAQVCQCIWSSSQTIGCIMGIHDWLVYISCTLLLAVCYGII